MPSRLPNECGPTHPIVERFGLTRIPTESSVSTNATIKDQPGAGRTVGLFLNYVGLSLENVLNRRAGRLGLGPKAVADKIRLCIGRSEGEIYNPCNRDFTKAETGAVKRLCKNLIRHAKYVTHE